MRKKLLLSFIISSIALCLFSCGNNNKVSDSTLTLINENIQESNVINQSENLVSTSWKFYEENNTIPTPDSSVKGIFLKEMSDGEYIYDLSDNSYDAEMNFKTYGSVLLYCGFTIENENGLNLILDESGEMVAAMGTGKEDDSYFLLIYIFGRK